MIAFLFIILYAVFFVEFARLIIKKTNQKNLIIAISVVFNILFCAFCLYQNNNLVVTKYSYNKENIKCRIVQVSDLHNKNFWFNENFLAEKVKEQKPDIIVITGDIADRTHTNIEGAIKTAEKLCEIADTYYVTGNHEKALPKSVQDKLFEGLKNAGVIILDDESAEITEFGENFTLIGLDDYSLGTPTLSTEIKNSNTNFNVVLAHEPQYLENYNKAGADLVFTGHAHGGQFRLPLLGPVIAPDQGFFPKLTEGEVISGGTTEIISRGLGNSLMPLRLFNYPEIVVVDIDS